MRVSGTIGMAGPDCAVMCNLTNTHTRTYDSSISSNHDATCGDREQFQYLLLKQSWYHISTCI